VTGSAGVPPALDEPLAAAGALAARWGTRPVSATMVDGDGWWDATALLADHDAVRAALSSVEPRAAAHVAGTLLMGELATDALMPVVLGWLGWGRVIDVSLDRLALRRAGPAAGASGALEVGVAAPRVLVGDDDPASGTPGATTSPLAEREAALTAIVHDGFAAPVVTALRSTTRAAARNLWGMAASAMANVVGGAPRVLPPDTPMVSDPPRAAADLLALIGGQLGARLDVHALERADSRDVWFIRDHCCMRYKVRPDARLCATCCLLPEGERVEVVAGLGARVQRVTSERARPT
jgi:hypothetical protein